MIGFSVQGQKILQPSLTDPGTRYRDTTNDCRRRRILPAPTKVTRLGEAPALSEPGRVRLALLLVRVAQVGELPEHVGVRPEAGGGDVPGEGPPLT